MNSDQSPDLRKAFKALKESYSETSLHNFEEIFLQWFDKVDQQSKALADANVNSALLVEEVETANELLEKSKAEILNILNAIDQGIITINSDLSINEQHSIKAEEIFEH